MELEKPIVAPFKVLVIVAHPDDIEFGSAGSVAVWTAAGAEVIYCIVTDGAAGSNDKDVIYNQLVERRQAEQIEAAQIVGVKEVVFLGYADGALTPSMELRRDLTRLIRRLDFRNFIGSSTTQVLISGEGFDYINHPDHRSAGEASLYAVFPSAETRPIFPELLEEGLEPHHVNELYLMMNDKPNIAIDVTTVWDKKIQSLLAHRSQVGEDVADMIRKWDVATGKEVGVELAESYRVMRFIDATPEKDTPAE